MTKRTISFNVYDNTSILLKIDLLPDDGERYNAIYLTKIVKTESRGISNNSGDFISTDGHVLKVTVKTGRDLDLVARSYDLMEFDEKQKLFRDLCSYLETAIRAKDLEGFEKWCDSGLADSVRYLALLKSKKISGKEGQEGQEDKEGYEDEPSNNP